MSTQELAGQVMDMQDFLHNIAFNLTRNHSSAEELVLITNERAIRYADYFDGTNLKGWLVTIIRNAFRNEYKSDIRANTALMSVDEMIDEGLDSNLDLVNSAEYMALADTFTPETLSAWNLLTMGQKEVIYLVDIQGYSYGEASKALHIEEGTVMSRLSRGRKVMRQAL
jgi:RNA polymerase sigma-70 factor, ECF subfamily